MRGPDYGGDSHTSLDMSHQTSAHCTLAMNPQRCKSSQLASYSFREG